MVSKKEKNCAYVVKHICQFITKTNEQLFSFCSVSFIIEL